MHKESISVFGSIDGDTIEISGSNQLIFAGDSDDLIDASTGEGNNRIYAGNGDDTLILGESDYSSNQTKISKTQKVITES